MFLFLALVVGHLFVSNGKVIIRSLIRPRLADNGLVVVQLIKNPEDLRF